MDRILNRQTTWYLINIKARRQQTTDHYISIFKSLHERDPLIEFPRGGKCSSLKNLTISETLDNDGFPCWISIGLLAYTIIDPDAFYNRRIGENVCMTNWNEDIVANKKETELYFIPSVHTIAVRCNSEISLKNIVYYLKTAFETIEPDTFDVDVVVERDVLDRIIHAYSITHFYANISYSNHGHSSNFEAAFDDKLRNMGASRVEFTAKGSEDNPLKADEDGLLQGIINLSEQNGYVRATIKRTANAKFEKIDSSSHPRKLVIPQIINNFCSTIYSTLRSIFAN